MREKERENEQTNESILYIWRSCRGDLQFDATGNRGGANLDRGRPICSGDAVRIDQSRSAFGQMSAIGTHVLAQKLAIEIQGVNLSVS